MLESKSATRSPNYKLTYEVTERSEPVFDIVEHGSDGEGAGHCRPHGSFHSKEQAEKIAALLNELEAKKIGC